MGMVVAMNTNTFKLVVIRVSELKYGTLTG